MNSAWKLKSLDDLVDLRNGVNFTQASSGQSLKVVGVGDFQKKEVLSDFSNTSSVVINGDIQQDDLLANNDLLFVRSNGNKALVGRCVIVKNISEPVTFSGFTIRARVKSPDIDPIFLSKLFRSSIFQRHLHWYGSGSSINNLSQDALAHFEFKLPLLKEQQDIAAIVQTWDEGIDIHDSLADSLERLHSALTLKLVFGRSRLAPYASSRTKKSYRWFDLPSDWRYERIGSLAREVSERNREDECAEILSCSKYDGFVRSLEYFKKQVFSSNLTGYKRIHRGDFGFPSNHVEEGSIGLQNLTDIGLVSPIYTVFRFSANKIDNEYAHYVLKTGLYRHIFEISTSASVDRRGSLRWNEFATIPFPVPSLEEQGEIVKVLHLSAKRLSVIREERLLLERQKRGLMQKLLTGEWRVN